MKYRKGFVSEMNSIVIYYSLEGNCRFLANIIADELHSDILEVKPIKINSSINIEKLKTIINIIFGLRPQVEDVDLNLGKYDTIFVGTPVRGRSFCPEIGGFLEKHVISGKKMGLFCAHGNAMGDVFGKMKKRLEGNCFIGEIAFEEPIKKDAHKVKAELIKWVKDLPKTE
jgi:flavodoxin